MYLIQILLPLYDNQKHPFVRAAFDKVRNELTEHFGGITAFLRSPAEGLWKADNETVSHDEVVIFEVMTDELDRTWWMQYRRQLETEFRQQEIIVRATQAEQL